MQFTVQILYVLKHPSYIGTIGVLFDLKYLGNYCSIHTLRFRSISMFEVFFEINLLFF